ncbi:MAG: SpoIIE family protein phosphatase [Armatimonadota bacterium]
MACNQGRKDSISIQDIAPRKIAGLTTVEQQMEMLDSITANTEASLIYLDRDFNFVWVNDTYAKKCARTKESFIGHNHFEFYPHEENQAIFKGVRDTCRPYKASRKPFIFPDHPEWGVTYWNWTLVPVLNASSEVIGFVFSLVDVTEDVLARQEIERLREEAQQRAAVLESFFSSITDGVTMFDAQGRIVMMNETGKEILGGTCISSLAELIKLLQTYSSKRTAIRTEDTASYRALNGEITKDIRHTVITPSGREMVLSVSASPVRDAQGNIIGAINVFRDITDWMDFEKRRQELYEREHHIAEVLQQAVVPPRAHYNIKGLSIAVKYQPALNEAEIGGDFYDIFELGEGRVGILIGDVAGKGLPAAMRVAAARYSVRSNAYLYPSPAKALELANKALCRDQSDSAGMLTSFFAVLDVNNGIMKYANGGHEPPVLCDAQGNYAELTNAGGALGISENFVYTESEQKLHPGDTIVMLTDGITEARKAHSQIFSKRRVCDFLAQNYSVSPDGIAFGLLEAARAHAGGELQDDVAIVVFRTRRVI